MARLRKPRTASPRRTPMSGTATGVLCVLVAVLTLGGAAVTLGVLFPSSYQEAREWAAARPCPAGGAAPECISAESAEVTGTSRVRVGRATRYHLHLRRQAEGGPVAAVQDFTVTLRGRLPVHGAAEAGDRVRVEYWRGEAQRVELNGARQWAREAAAGGDRVQLGVGLGLLPLGALFAWLGRLLLRWGARPVPQLRTSSFLIAALPLVAAIAAGCAAPVLLDGAARPIAVALGADVVCGAALAAFLARRTRHTTP